MSVDESWQRRIFTAGILNFTLEKQKIYECFHFVSTSIRYMILLEMHSSTAKQDRMTSNSHQLSFSFNPAFSTTCTGHMSDTRGPGQQRLSKTIVP